MNFTKKQLKPFVTVKNTEDTFDTWLSKEYIPEELRSILSTATILIVPQERLVNDVQVPLFPSETEDVFRYFRKKMPAGQSIDILASDNPTEVLGLYDDSVTLGHFLIYNTAIPLFIGIISSYIYDKFIKHRNGDPQIQVIDNSINKSNSDIHISSFQDKAHLAAHNNIQLSVTVIKDNSAKQVEYKGAASEINVLEKVLRQINEV